MQENETVVAAAAPLINVGDPLDLEVVADLLSSDTAEIKRGAPVEIEGWGGPPVRGRVTRINPAGFMKVSALGIEEQRVRVTIDFAEPPAARSQLGHDYRVIVHVTTWKADDVLTVAVRRRFARVTSGPSSLSKAGGPTPRSSMSAIGTRASPRSCRASRQATRSSFILATGSATARPFPSGMYADWGGHTFGGNRKAAWTRP